MSMAAVIAIIVILDVALLAFVGWMMSHPRHLRPHVPGSAEHSRAPRFMTRHADGDTAAVQRELEVEYNA